MTFTEFMDHAAQAFELVAAAVLAVGLVAAPVLAGVMWLRNRLDGGGAFRLLREFFGGALLLSLEILVAADLLRTVAVTPTLESVGVLGIIVLIRTLLSFSLEIEIEGVAPWRRAATSGASIARRAIAGATAGNAEPPETP